MGAGIFQLVAKSIEDLILTGNPEVTLFKIVYRKHVDFSSEDKKLRFKSKLRFGKHSKCRIKRFGDFINTLFLEMNITSPDVRYNKLNIIDIKNILSKYDIIFTTTKKNVSTELLSDVEELINNTEILYENEKNAIYTDDISDNILNTFKEIKDAFIDDNSISSNDFYDLLIRAIMFHDIDNNASYYFVDSYNDDKISENNDTVTNISVLRNLIYDRLLLQIIPKSSSSFNDENINILNDIDQESFFIQSFDLGISAKSHFLKKLGTKPNNSEYTTYDAYKLFETYLINNNIDIFSEDTVTFIKNEVYNSVYFGLIRNLLLLEILYKNLKRDYNFIFYKKLRYNSSSDTYFNKDKFIALSLIDRHPDTALFNNNFDEYLNIGKISGEDKKSYYKYLDIILDKVHNLHINNDSLFKKINVESFFRVKELWEDIGPVDIVPSTLTSSESTIFSNTRLLNFVPQIVPTEIDEALSTINTQILGTYGDNNFGNIIGFINFISKYYTPLKNSLTNDINVEDYFNSDRKSKLIELINTYGESSKDIFITAMFQKEAYFNFDNKNYNVMEYLKQIYFDRFNSVVEDYTSQRNLNTLNSDMNLIVINDDTIGNKDTKKIQKLEFRDITTNYTNVFNSNSSNFFIIYSENDNKKYTIWFDNNTLEPNSDDHIHISDSTKLKIEITSSSTPTSIVEDIKDILNNTSEFSVTRTGTTLTITNNSKGHSKIIYSAKMPYLFNSSVINTGSETDKRSENFTFNNGIFYNKTGKSNYFTIYSTNNNDRVYVWLEVDSSSSDPSLTTIHTEGIKVSINSTDTSSQIATKVKNSIDSHSSFSSSVSNSTVTVSTITNGVAGPFNLSEGERYNTFFDSIDMFFTDINSFNHSDYIENGRTFFQINRSRINNLATNPFESSSTTPNRKDVSCSMWYNISNDMITNFNSFYNFDALSEKFVFETMGAESERIRQHIGFNKTADILVDFNDNNFIDYYRASQSSNITSAVNYIVDLINPLTNSLNKFNNNKDALNLRSIDIPNSLEFESFNNMFNFFTNKIYSSYDSTNEKDAIVNLGFNHDPNIISWNDIKIFLTTKNVYNQDEIGVKGTMDFYNDLLTISEIFFDTDNTVGSSFPNISSSSIFNGIDTSTLELTYNTFISPKTSMEREELYQSFLKIVGPSEITAEKLFNDIVNISNNYNGFTKEKDIYEYLYEKISDNGYGRFYSDIQGSIKLDIYNKFKNRAENRGDILTGYLNKIKGIGTTSLNDDIKNKYNRQNKLAPFAWVERIGHSIIKKTYIDIGGQIIETHDGKLIDAISKLYDNPGKIKGLKKLIGDTVENKTYNKTEKPLKLNIPLRFFFNRRYECSLPILAMHSTYTDIYVELNDLSNVMYTEPDTYIKKKPKIKSHLMGKYIFIDTEERKKYVDNRIEMLIDPYNISTFKKVNYETIKDESFIRITPVFKGMCKDILFSVQNSKYTNGTLQKLETKNVFENKSIISKNIIVSNTRIEPFFYGTDDNGLGNPIDDIRISFNGKNREQYKSSLYYDFVQQYSRHMYNINDGFMSYSLSLYPPLLQPSGHATLSRITRVDIDFRLKNKIIQEMKNNDKKLTFRFYTHYHTILRFMSGMSGLSFFS